MLKSAEHLFTPSDTERNEIAMQVSFSTKSIHGLSRTGAGRCGVPAGDAYGITLDVETFYSRNALAYYGKIESDTNAVRERFAEFLLDCTESGVPLHAMRMPRLGWDTKRTDLNDLMLRIGQEGIGACAQAACGYIVIQPLFAGIPGEELWKENHRYYAALGQTAKQAGIRILMENQCGYVNGHLVRGACADAAVAAAWIDELNGEFGEELFGFCLDTGACNLCRQDMGETAAALGDRLKAVMIRECDAVREASRLPYTGRSAAGQDADWQSLIRGLRRIAFDGILIMDAGDTLKGFSHLLRPHVYALICATADYLRWQIGMERDIKEYPARVLFGAGNMCRQYMAYYGEQYPPLYISDNNPELWGTKVCGREVRAPEELKDLPEECVVIICNTFYEEIAAQLRSLGVRRIGTFSDECLRALDTNSDT